jgi:hypothetical protein
LQASSDLPPDVDHVEFHGKDGVGTLTIYFTTDMKQDFPANVLGWSNFDDGTDKWTPAGTGAWSDSSTLTLDYVAAVVVTPEPLVLVYSVPPGVMIGLDPPLELLPGSFDVTII